MQHRAQALPSPSLVTSPFLPQVFLMMFVVYFVVSESLSIKKEGRAYFTLWGSYGQWVFILLSTCTVVVHLSQATLADQQWLKYLNNRKGFTNFYQVAVLNTVFSALAASLLFLLTVQVRRGLGGSSTGMSFAQLWCSCASPAALGSPTAGPCSKSKRRSAVLLCGRRWNVPGMLLHPDPVQDGVETARPRAPRQLCCVSIASQLPWGAQPGVADGLALSARSLLNGMLSALPECEFLRLVEMFERPSRHMSKEGRDGGSGFEGRRKICSVAAVGWSCFKGTRRGLVLNVLNRNV